MSISKRIALASGCDENYAVALAVTVRSALNHLGSDRAIDLYLLDGGIKPQTIERLKMGWNDPRLCVHVVKVDMDQLTDLPTEGHVTASSYLRLLIPRLLPQSLDRVIYIDSDMLVRRDIAKLFDVDMNGYSTMAVQDYAAPYIDSEVATAAAQQCDREFVAKRPIVNYRPLGLDGKSKYFNGGLLVIDLHQWRDQQYDRKMIECLRDNREYVLWWDQYALNVVLHGQWGDLNPRWNQGAHLFEYSDAKSSPFDAATHRQLIADPWVVHFCSPSKPWHYFCLHPYRGEFKAVLNQTQWSDYQPDRPKRRFVKKWVRHQFASRGRRQLEFAAMVQRRAA